MNKKNIHQGDIMKRLISAMVLCGVLFLSSAVSGDEFSPDSIKTLMKKAANYSFQQFGAGTAAGLDNDWSRGTILTGIMGLYRVTQEKQWLDSVDKWGTKYNWTWKNNGSADNHCCMQTYCERYMVNPISANSYMYTPSLANINSMMKGPGHGLWGWQDAMYMSPPVWSMIGSITGQNIYFDSLTSFWWDNVKHLYDTTYHLWYWSDDAASWFTTPKGYPKFWGPGNAWVIGGMIRCIKYMPLNYSQRPKWIALFKEFSDAVRSKQQPDGMWRTSLYEPTEFPDPEASCTSFFIYAFSLGVNWGLLDSATYVPVIRKGWKALDTCVESNGRIKRCQPWSNAPGGVGTNNIPEGQGAFMLAGEGVNLLVTTPTIARQNYLMQTSSNGRVDGNRKLCVSGNSYSLKVPDNVRTLAVFNLQGRKIWHGSVNDLNGKTVSLPHDLQAHGILYFRFE
jgi:unsaturated rhamnogalacturonyl hydrolase